MKTKLLKEEELQLQCKTKAVEQIAVLYVLLQALKNRKTS